MQCLSFYKSKHAFFLRLLNKSQYFVQDCSLSSMFTTQKDNLHHNKMSVMSCLCKMDLYHDREVILMSSVSFKVHFEDLKMTVNFRPIVSLSIILKYQTYINCNMFYIKFMILSVPEKNKTYKSLILNVCSKIIILK